MQSVTITGLQLKVLLHCEAHINMCQQHKWQLAAHSQEMHSVILLVLFNTCMQLNLSSNLAALLHPEPGFSPNVGAFKFVMALLKPHSIVILLS